MTGGVGAFPSRQSPNDYVAKSASSIGSPQIADCLPSVV